MAYDGKVMRRAMARYRADKARRAEQVAERREQVYARIPRLEEIERELGQTMAKIVSGALRTGADPRPALKVLQDENLELQRQRRELLAANGYPADYLEDRPLCQKCNDTGYTAAGVCSCLQGYYHSEQIRELSHMLDLGTQSFETFDFDWYSDEPEPEVGRSPRAQMERNFDVCESYARHFGPRSENLLLSGDPGLGKTFLSACIARVVSEDGYSVVYDTAAHVFSRMEAAKFRRGDEDDDGAADDVTRYEECDLLILDDLGTEMTTGFVQSALYQLVNGRLLNNRKTIISTNLSPGDLEVRYSPQVASRLTGEYRVLGFFGRDIRQLKRDRER